MANSVLVKLTVLGMCVVTCLEAADKVSNNPMAKALHTLTEEEKTDFLAFFLALGLKEFKDTDIFRPKNSMIEERIINSLNIPKENIEKFKKMNIPKDSSKKLLLWTQREFNLTKQNVRELIRTKKCSGSICLPDIGELCCPW